MSVAKERKVVEIPQKSWIVCCAKKKDNSEYQPDTMSSFSRSTSNSVLDDNNAKVNIVKDEEFKVSRVLKSKRRELRK